MARRSRYACLWVSTALTMGCQLITDFPDDRDTGTAGTTSTDLAGNANKSGAGGSGATKAGDSNARSTTDIGTAQAGSGTIGGAGHTDTGGSGGSIGTSNGASPLGGAAAGTTSVDLGNGGNTGTGTTAGIPSGGSGAGMTTATDGTTTGTSVPSCTIEGVAYPADTKKGDNECLSCQPNISNAHWTMVTNGTQCGTDMVCNGGACQTGCWIDSKFVPESTVNPDNPCRTCKSSISTSAWSNAPSRYCVQGISAGNGHACALVDGSIYCWGVNDVGQLGIGTTSTSYTPVRKVFAQYSKAIACGGNSSCAIRNGHIYCWGDNALGQLGYGEQGGASNTYMEVSGLEVGANVVAVGRVSACAIRDASAFCWGNNDDGELGDGSNTARPSAGGVRGPLSGVTAISVGLTHACAISAGAAKCWGSDIYGKLGVDTNPGSNVPVQVTGLSSGVTVISAGDDSTCAVVNGAAQCWGSNAHGMLGSPNTGSFSAIPVQVVGLEKGVTSVTVGGSFACAIVNGGAVCWGYNDFGQLGNGSKHESSVPVPVADLSAGVTAIAAGWSHVCAIASGEAYCWGMNHNGRLGIGNGVTESLVPVKLNFDYDNAS